MRPPATSRRRRRAFWATIGWVSGALLAAMPAAAQAFLEQGPGPASVLPFWYQYQGTAASGAVQAIAPSATDPNVLYLGATNGGVWGSTNGGASWQPLTDGQASLSVGALAVDPTNSNHIIAAIARTSSAATRGGPLTGILTSSNGGQSWTSIPTAALPGGTVANFEALVYAGGSIIAGSNGTLGGADANAIGGIYRIDSAGKATLIGAGIDPATVAADPAKPLAAGLPVTGLAVDRSNSNVIYAAVTGDQANPILNGVYRSNNNGQSFTRILDSMTPNVGASLASSVNMRVATAANGAVYLVTSAPTTGRASNVDQLLRRDPVTGNWTALPLATPLQSAEQGSLHLALAVDPGNSNVVYVGSSPPSAAQNQDEGGSSNLFRGVIDPATGNVAWTDIASVATNPHSDFRTISFDASGNILLGSDGGLYRNSALLTANSAWQPIMNGYVGGEMYGVAWNPISKTIAGAFQDNGDSLQTSRGSRAWQQVLGADGTNVAINAVSLRSQGLAVLYGTTQSLGFFQRFTLDAQNDFVGQPVQLAPTLGGTALPSQTFLAKIALNAQDPTLFAIGGSRFYVGRDDLTNTGTTFSSDFNALVKPVPVADVTGTNTLSAARGVTAVAFGTREARWEYALAGAASDSSGAVRLYVTPNATAPGTAMQQLNLPVDLPSIAAVVLDPTQPGQLFAAGARNVFVVEADAACLSGAACAVRDLGTTLPATLTSVGAAEAIDNNGVRALFVGGLSNVATGNGVSNIYDLQDDPTHTWQSTLWQAFGSGLPNVAVTQLAYSYGDDLLSVATLGRGAWVIPDVTSYFPSATRIVLGNADFDSTRGDSFTDGTTGGRPLVKLGAGTVTLTGSNSYTGGTFLNTGVLAVSSDANLGAPTGGLTFNGGTLRNTAAFTSARNVALNTSGTFETQAPLSLAGVISGAGGLFKTGNEVLTLAGTNTYAGGTTVNAGTLSVSSDANLGGPSGGLSLAGGTLSNSAALASARSVSLAGAGGSFATQAPLTLDGTISGAGGLTKTGPSMLTLTAGNSYAGGTTVNAGTLSVASDANLGAASGGLTLAGGTLSNSAGFASARGVSLAGVGGSFATQAPLTLDGTISGPGGLTKTGPSMLTLTAANSYAGGTTVTAGTLSVASDANLGAASGGLTLAGGTLSNSAGFASARSVSLAGIGGSFATQAPLTLDGTISGSGGLTKTGPSMLTLTAANGYTGGTTVNAGTLSVASDANLGAASGGLTLDGGTLSNSAALALARNITLGSNGGVFQTPAVLMLNGAIGGPGGLTVAGSQLLVLNGAGQYTGPTSVVAGSLAVNGSTGAGLTSVAKSAALGGTGTIGGSLVNNGTLLPGTTLVGGTGGMLHVAGNFTQTPSGLLQVNLGSGSPVLQVGGAVQAGGTLAVNATGKIGTSNAVLITAAGPTSGSFNLQAPSTPFLQSSLVYQTGQIGLSVDRNFTLPAISTNEVAVGSYLNQNYLTAPQANLDPLFAALDNSGSGGGAAAALDQLGGAALGSATTSTLAAQILFGDTVEQRLAQVRLGGAAAGSDLAFAPLQVASNAPLASMTSVLAQMADASGGTTGRSSDQTAPPSWHGVSVWARGLGGWGNFGSDGNAPAVSTSVGGLMVGADTAITDQWLVGGALGYASSWAQSYNSSVRGSNYQATAYAGWHAAPFFADAQTGYTHADYSTRRSLDIGGLMQSAQGKPDGDNADIVLRAGLSLPVGPLLVEPSFGADWYRLTRSGFNETGATTIGLRVASQEIDVVQPSIGVRVASQFKAASNLLVIPEATVRYFHDVGDGVVPVTASLAGAGARGGAFTTYAAYPGRDSVTVGGGVAAQTRSGVRLFVDYDAQLAARLTAHAVAGGLRVTF